MERFRIKRGVGVLLSDGAFDVAFSYPSLIVWSLIDLLVGAAVRAKPVARSAMVSDPSYSNVSVNVSIRILSQHRRSHNPGKVRRV